MAPRFRLLPLAWAGVYPLISVIFWLFGDALAALPLLLRTMFISGIIVSFMVLFWIPLMNERFGRWIRGVR